MKSRVTVALCSGTGKTGSLRYLQQKEGLMYGIIKIVDSVIITMGLYTLDGKLTDKRDIELAADHTQKEAWINKKGIYYPATRKMIKKMLRTLKSGEGYVRIICARKGATDFDLKIMPYVEPSEVK